MNAHVNPCPPSRLAVPASARGRVISFLPDATRGSDPARASSRPAGPDADAALELGVSFATPMRLRKRATLYRAGENFTTLHVVRVGTFKTVALAEDGREQITGYHMGGDILGFDGISEARHACAAIALEDSEVASLSFGKLDEMARRDPILRGKLYRAISRDASRHQEMMMLLGGMRADERVAVFLLTLSRRFRCRGYSGIEFTLRMTREEIASYLGLKLETVSRTFSHLHEQGMIQVQGRAVKVLDRTALDRLAGRTNRPGDTP